MEAVDDPSRGPAIRQRILRKAGLRKLYEEFYEEYARVLSECPSRGVVLEIGSGVGFAADWIPGLVASDILPYEGLRLQCDATRLPFPDGSIRMMCMLNTFHHIPDVGAFLSEAQRCLLPGGKVVLIDQHRGWISRWILRYLHSEPYDPRTTDWRFATSGPLSGANGALAWIVFRRDVELFNKRFAQLRLERYEPIAPLRFWLAGGLKRWSLLPGVLFRAARSLDRALLALSPQWGSFVTIVLGKEEGLRK